MDRSVTAMGIYSERPALRYPRRSFARFCRSSAAEASASVGKGTAHTWKVWEKDAATFVDWFDRHLKTPAQ